MANIAKMMKQAQQMQGQLRKIQSEVAEMELSYSLAGAIEVTARGTGRISKIKISPAAIDTDDMEGLEDLILTAVNGAIDKVMTEAQKKMSSVTGGLGGLDGLL